MEIRTYTLLEMKELLIQLRSIYDEVRLVDPEACREIILPQEIGPVTYGSACFSIWGNLNRCDLCTSLKASRNARRCIKEEILSGSPVDIQSIPVRLALSDASPLPCVVETICRAEEQEGMANALVSRYILIAEIDLKKDWCYLVYYTKEHGDLGFVPDGQYSELVEKYCHERLDPEVAALWIRQGSANNIRERLMDADSFEICYAIRGGKWRSVEFHVSARDVSGRAVRVLLCFKKLDDDRTMIHRLHEERTRALEALEVALKEARHSSDAKTAFLANMSHDIRTPMSAILGFTQLALGEDVTMEEMRDYLEKIRISGFHMMGLVNKVLDLVRIESGRVQLDETPVDLSKVLKEVGTIMMPLARARMETLTVDAEGLIHSLVFCDSQRLSQVLTNLVQNAVKFTPEGGRVILKAVEKNCQVPGYGAYVFSVEDTGCGISEAYLERIFEPFEQEENEYSHINEGNGLGLAIVRQLVSLCGGTIRVESKQGKGSIFSIFLELRLQEHELLEAAPGKVHREIKEGSFMGRRILVAEDNAINRMIMKKIIERLGIAVEEAVDGQKALEMVKAHEAGWYDCVLMDIRMPEMDGLEATRQIRALSDAALAATPVVGVSANAFTEDRENARRTGMNGYVAKPVRMEELGYVLDCIFSGRPVEGAGEVKRQPADSMEQQAGCGI